VNKDDLTVREVAERLGLSKSRIFHMIRDGRLPATRFGTVWVIRERDLAKVLERKTGRPRKDTNGK
jgi:excisionase family DNA binding protein